MTVARTPSGYTEDGSIYLTPDIHKGEKVRLSYGNPAHILVESFKMCQGMANFEPQGLMAWICGNRIAILKEAGKKEVSYYSKLFPHAIGAYSFAEIIQCSRGGGVLNRLAMPPPDSGFMIIICAVAGCASAIGIGIPRA